MIEAISPQSTVQLSEAAQPAEQSQSSLTDNFLRILTQELQTQDPMSPMDQGDMFNQIARITELQGLNEQSSYLSQIADQQAAFSQLATLSLLDREVMVPTTEVTLDQSALEFKALAPTQEELTATLVDATGKTIAQTQALPDISGIATFEFARNAVDAEDGAQLNVRVTPTNSDVDLARPITTYAKSTVHGISFAGSEILVDTELGSHATSDLFWVGGSGPVLPTAPSTPTEELNP